MARPIGNACALPLKPPRFKAIFSYTHRKLYGGIDMYLLSFLLSMSDGYQWLASRPIPLTPKGYYTLHPWPLNRRLGGYQSGLDAFQNRRES